MEEKVECSWCGVTAPPRDYNILGEPLPPHDWGDDWSKDPPRFWCSAECAYQDVSRDEYKELKERDMTGDITTISFEESTSIRGAEYDPMMRTLTIHFRSGGVYDFLEVPRSVFQEFANAESAGRFFHEYIRNEYDSMKR